MPALPAWDFFNLTEISTERNLTLPTALAGGFLKSPQTDLQRGTRNEN
jgi:hypothetical protein